MKKSWIKIPYEVIDEGCNQEVLLPLYVYLMMNVGEAKQIHTSIAYLLFQCGYNYNSNSKIRGHLEKVQDALQWLYDNEYIFAFEHPLNGDQFESINSAKPTQYFNIELTEKATNVERRYVIMYTEEYIKLHSLFFEKEFRAYCKLVNLFCFILRNVIFKKDQDITYYVASINKLVQCNSAGSHSTVYKLLPQLEELELLHSSKNERSNTHKFYKLSHVFVRHHDNWQYDLERAVKLYQIDRESYFRWNGGAE